MRRVLVLLVMAALAVTLTACMSDDDASSQSRRPAAVSSSAPTYAGFRLELDGSLVRAARSWSWGASVDAIEQKTTDGAGNTTITSVPGALSAKALIVTMSLPEGSAELLDALAARQLGNMTLELLDSNLNVIATYSFSGVWVSEIDQSADASNATSAIGKVTFRYGTLTLASGGAQGSIGAK